MVCIFDYAVIRDKSLFESDVLIIIVINKIKRRLKQFI